MSVAFVFPGQGSQQPGMLHHLLNHPAIGRTLDEISEELHSDVRNLDTEHCLQSDVSVQLALFASGVATARALMEQDLRPTATAGLSVGAFAAAVTAGVLLYPILGLAAAPDAAIAVPKFGPCLLLKPRKSQMFCPSTLTRVGR